jgi:hypothetical protein
VKGHGEIHDVTLRSTDLQRIDDEEKPKSFVRMWLHPISQSGF